jgi:hypothetical protein
LGYWGITGCVNEVRLIAPISSKYCSEIQQELRHGTIKIGQKRKATGMAVAINGDNLGMSQNYHKNLFGLSSFNTRP